MPFFSGEYAVFIFFVRSNKEVLVTYFEIKRKSIYLPHLHYLLLTTLERPIISHLQPNFSSVNQSLVYISHHRSMQRISDVVTSHVYTGSHGTQKIRWDSAVPPPAPHKNSSAAERRRDQPAERCATSQPLTTLSPQQYAENGGITHFCLQQRHFTHFYRPTQREIIARQLQKYCRKTWWDSMVKSGENVTVMAQICMSFNAISGKRRWCKVINWKLRQEK